MCIWLMKGFVLLALFCLVTKSSLILLWSLGCSPLGSSVHGGFPGKNTRVGCHFLFWGLFPAQGSNLCLPNCRQILYHWATCGKPSFSFLGGQSHTQWGREETDGAEAPSLPSSVPPSLFFLSLLNGCNSQIQQGPQEQLWTEADRTQSGAWGGWGGECDWSVSP